MTARTRQTAIFFAIVLVTAAAAWFVMGMPQSGEREASNGRSGARDVVQQYPSGNDRQSLRSTSPCSTARCSVTRTCAAR